MPSRNRGQEKEMGTHCVNAVPLIQDIIGEETLMTSVYIWVMFCVCVSVHCLCVLLFLGCWIFKGCIFKHHIFNKISIRTPSKEILEASVAKFS